MKMPPWGEWRRVVAQLAPVVALLLLASCQGRKQEFLGARVEERCDSEWPICSTFAGCMLGDRSYVEGRFPNANRFIVQLFEPSEVTVSFFLEEMGGLGSETVINFYEDRCRSRVQQLITGKALIGESDKQGYVKRSADLVGQGDHLIEFSSDARAAYTVKVDVLPLRLRDVQ